MTITSTTTRAYDDAETTICEECRDTVPADDAFDCGAHLLCEDCLMASPCRGCRAIADTLWADRVVEQDFNTAREGGWDQ